MDSTVTASDEGRWGDRGQSLILMWHNEVTTHWGLSLRGPGSLSQPAFPAMDGAAWKAWRGDRRCHLFSPALLRLCPAE